MPTYQLLSSHYSRLLGFQLEQASQPQRSARYQAFAGRLGLIRAGTDIIVHPGAGIDSMPAPKLDTKKGQK